MKQHLKGKFLLPKAFKTENRIQELKGVYVPFWLYDCEAAADIRCRGTRIRVWRRGDREYTETSHYLVSRSGTIAFDSVPVDGSRKMADDLMESIEPYRYQEGKAFQPAYLAGYLADRMTLGRRSARQEPMRGSGRAQKKRSWTPYGVMRSASPCIRTSA